MTHVIVLPSEPTRCRVRASKRARLLRRRPRPGRPRSWPPRPWRRSRCSARWPLERRPRPASAGWPASLRPGSRRLLGGAARRAGATALGPADLVTLGRALLVGGVTALVADGLGGDGSGGDARACSPSVALALDAVDGQVARRTGTVVGAGRPLRHGGRRVPRPGAERARRRARGAVGAGHRRMRYVFVAAAWVLPWLRERCRPGTRRRSWPRCRASCSWWRRGCSWRRWRRRRWSWPRWRAVLVVRPGRGVAVAGPRVVRAIGEAAVASRAARPPRAAVLVGADRRVTRRAGAGRAAGARRRSVRRCWPSRSCGRPARARRPRAAPRAQPLTPLALIRIPVEALLGVALLLVLPAADPAGRGRRRRRALGVLAIFKVFDMGFLSVLGRPFDPVFDWVLLGDAPEFLERLVRARPARSARRSPPSGSPFSWSSLRRWRSCGISRLVGRHRRARPGPSQCSPWPGSPPSRSARSSSRRFPVAARSAAALAYEKARQVPASLRDEREFAAQAAVDGFRATPPDDLLSALRGKDVVLAFIESYGRNAVEDPQLAAGDRACSTPGRRAGRRRVRRAQRLAHLPGGGRRQLDGPRDVRLRPEDRQPAALPQPGLRRPPDADLRFRRRGLGDGRVMPGTNRAWPEGEFFGFDRVHDSRTLGYRGPNFAGRRCPTSTRCRPSSALRRAADRGPLMARARADLQPRAVDAVPKLGRLGRGRRRRGVRPAGGRGRAGRRGVEERRPRARGVPRLHRLLAGQLISYVERYGDDDLVLIFLGDHQPASIITGDNASHDVPITIVAKDPAVLDRSRAGSGTRGSGPARRPRCGRWSRSATGSSRRSGRSTCRRADRALRSSWRFLQSPAQQQAAVGVSELNSGRTRRSRASQCASLGRVARHALPRRRPRDRRRRRVTADHAALRQRSRRSRNPAATLAVITHGPGRAAAAVRTRTPAAVPPRCRRAPPRTRR